MGCRILAGKEYDDSPEQAVFFCSTTDVAFGPVMASREEAEAFCGWLPDDPRGYPPQDLMSMYAQFLAIFVCECGQLKDEDECEKLASLLSPAGCTCPNNGGGDCPWCENKSIAQDSEPIDGERFECASCMKKRQAKKVSA